MPEVEVRVHSARIEDAAITFTTTRLPITERINTSMFHGAPVNSAPTPRLKQVIGRLSKHTRCWDVTFDTPTAEHGAQQSTIRFQLIHGDSETVADFLDDLLRIAGWPAHTTATDTQAMEAALLEVFSALMAMPELPQPTTYGVISAGVSTGKEQSALCAWFGYELATQEAELSRQDILDPDHSMMAALPPWLAGLLRGLADRQVIAKLNFGVIASTTASRSLWVYSLGVSDERPTAIDCLELVIRTAEELSNFTPTAQAVTATNRERLRYSEHSEDITPPGVILARWLLVLRHCASVG